MNSFMADNSILRRFEKEQGKSQAFQVRAWNSMRRGLSKRQVGYSSIYLLYWG